MTSFRAGRSQIGELLMAMIVEDMGNEEHTVIIEGDAVREDRTVVINKTEVDPDTQQPYLSNDLQRTRMKVALEDVPSTPSYRGQQLNALSEAVKSLPDKYKAAVMPFLASLMDVPFKRDLIEALRAADAQDSPEQMEQRIQEAVRDALAKSGHDLKARELDLKYSPEKVAAEIQNIVADTVVKGVQAAFSAMQGGAQVAAMPQIAPIADVIMQGAGYRKPNPGGDDPNFPQPNVAPALPGAAPQVETNTSPTFPPVPSSPGAGLDGIETADTADNLV